MSIEPHTTTAWIFQPAPNAMQSGRRRRLWHLEFDPAEAQRQRLSPLMGWAGGGDMDQQLVMRFPTREAAIAFCTRHGIRYTVEPPPHQAITPKSYATNFMPRPR